MMNYHKKNIIKLAFNNVEIHKSRNICIGRSNVVLDGPGSKTALVTFALATQNTWDLNARTRKVGITNQSLTSA